MISIFFVWCLLCNFIYANISIWRRCWLIKLGTQVLILNFFFVLIYIWYLLKWYVIKWIVLQMKSRDENQRRRYKQIVLLLPLFSLNSFVDVAHKSFYISFNSSTYIYRCVMKKKLWAELGLQVQIVVYYILPIIILFPC